MNNKKEMRITKDSSQLKINILSLEYADAEKLYVVCIKNFKNIKIGNIYFIKREGYKKRQTFYLLKGRWVHSSYVRKINLKELNVIKRKRKIKMLLKEK